MRNDPNPKPSLFTTYERVDTCHRVEITEDNLHEIARYFDWEVKYRNGRAELWRPGSGSLDVGAWIDHRGSRWNPESPIAQGWSPEGTFTTPATRTPARDGAEGGEGS